MEKNIIPTANGSHYSAINIGRLDDIKDYVLPLPNGEMKGKVFLKNSLELTGAEISFQYLPGGTELPFFHKHKENEEIYIFLKGTGKFQVDDDVFSISEGSVVRVATSGNRSLINSSNSPMIYMVIQAKENSLSQWTATDGEIEPYKSLLA